MGHPWKKQVRGGLLALACLAAFTGCGGQQTTSYTVPQKTQALLDRTDTPDAIDRELAKRFTATQKAARKLVQKQGDTITVTHKYGTTVMPKNPRRIVVIRLEDLTEVLGVPVVGANYNDRSYLYQGLKAKNVTPISVNDDSKTINYEEVQSLQPDLILLRDSFDQSVYDKLSRIAPTAAFNIRKEETALLALAMALDEEKQGQDRLRQFYRTVKDDRLKLHEALGNKKVAFLRIMNREVRLYPYSRNDINRFMYDLLDLKPPQMVLEADASKTNNAISLERLPDLDADYLLVSTGYGASSGETGSIAREKYKKLQQDALWQLIPAVREGHVHEVDALIWNAHGIIAKERAMEEIVEAWGNK
ncbi:MAG: ABC transporter substrate-binding protein [Acidaminococcus sp.]|uniref:ABC transporter substrate-binding protein n=1 Tax=Acidaminococcus sp. TaxID=1872103 RepID=UPI003F150D21